MTRICSIEDCDRPSRARGMCNMHYKRVKAGRDPLDPGVVRNRTYTLREDIDCVACGKSFSPRDSKHEFCSKRCANSRPESGRQRSTESDFWSKVGPPDPITGCRLWQGAEMERGYGQFVMGGKVKRAHQWSFFFSNGCEPENWVLHRCGVKLCVEPAHLYDGTPKDNAQDGLRLGENYQASKTHCVNGHAFDDENTSIATNGQRVCRACSRESARRYAARQRLTIGA